MNGTDMLAMYALSREASLCMGRGEYAQACAALKSIAAKLIAEKAGAGLVWKLRITELIALGVAVPLQMFSLYGPGLKGCPDEIVRLAGSELKALQSGFESLISSSPESFCYKISNN